MLRAFFCEIISQVNIDFTRVPIYKKWTKFGFYIWNFCIFRNEWLMLYGIILWRALKFALFLEYPRSYLPREFHQSLSSCYWRVTPFLSWAQKPKVMLILLFPKYWWEHGIIYYSLCFRRKLGNQTFVVVCSTSIPDQHLKNFTHHQGPHYDLKMWNVLKLF